MKRSFLKFSVAALAGLGLLGFATRLPAQPGGNPGRGVGIPNSGAQGLNSTGAPAPGTQIGPPGGNVNGTGGTMNGAGGTTPQTNGGAGIAQGTPGGTPGGQPAMFNNNSPFNTNSAYSRFGMANGPFGSTGNPNLSGAYGTNGAYGTSLTANGLYGNGYGNGAYPTGSYSTGLFPGNPNGIYTGLSNGFYAPNYPQSAYQSVANPGQAFAAEYYARFNPNYGNNFYGTNLGAYGNSYPNGNYGNTYPNGNGEPTSGYNGYSPYYGNNGGTGFNAAPPANYAPMNSGTGYVPPSYEYGISQSPQTGAYSNMGVPSATESAPVAGTFGWF